MKTKSDGSTRREFLGALLTIPAAAALPGMVTDGEPVLRELSTRAPAHWRPPDSWFDRVVRPPVRVFVDGEETPFEISEIGPGKIITTVKPGTSITVERHFKPMPLPDELIKLAIT